MAKRLLLTQPMIRNASAAASSVFSMDDTLVIGVYCSWAILYVARHATVLRQRHGPMLSSRFATQSFRVLGLNLFDQISQRRVEHRLKATSVPLLLTP